MQSLHPVLTLVMPPDDVHSTAHGPPVTADEVLPVPPSPGAPPSATGPPSPLLVSATAPHTVG